MAESVNSSELADALLEINKDSMSDNGKNLYDSISGDIFPAACKRKTANAENSLDSGAYDDAIAELTKVLTMDSSYNDGKAIYLIAQAYQGKQDTENAKKYYQMYLLDFLELSLCLIFMRIVDIRIRMILTAQFSVCLLNLLIRCTLVYS